MTDTETLIRDCLSTYAEEAELVDLVGPAKARSRQLARRSQQSAKSTMRGRLRGWFGANGSSIFRSKRFLVIAAGTAVVVLIATAFALGGRTPTNRTQLARQADLVTSRPQAIQGNGQGTGTRSSASSAGTQAPARNSPTGAAGLPGSAAGGNGSVAGATPALPPVRAVPAPHAAHGALSDNAPTPATTAVGNGATATRVVKTGDMSITVPKGQVQTTITTLVNQASHLGGYVSQSRTDTVAGSPEGEVTLRIPVNSFEDAVAGAGKLGHQTSLSTNAHDVTGKFVDISARLSALKRTRSTYLTILGRATTIGQTLSVQQRVDDIQQQIESLQGQLKVLRNQSADGTLTVDVTQVGAPATVVPLHHKRHGIGKAWHTSISRFSRGIDAIVAALGPLLLALILLGLIIGAGWLGVRRFGRATT